MQALTIATYSGEVTQHNPDISGFDDQGTATATSKVTSIKADLQKTSIGSSSDRRFRGFGAYSWSDSRLAVNYSELEENITGKHRSLRDPKLIAKGLDTAVKQGLRKAGTDKLIREDMLWKSMGFGADTVFGMQVALQYYGEVSSLSLAAIMAGSVARMHITNQVLDTGIWTIFGERPKDRRLSLFMGLQLDRYVVLQGLSRIGRLVTATTAEQSDVRI